MNGDCPKGRENETNIKGIKDDIGSIMEWVRRVEDKIDKALYTAMRRPGWPVCAAISILLAAVAALVTLLTT